MLLVLFNYFGNDKVEDLIFVVLVFEVFVIWFFKKVLILLLNLDDMFCVYFIILVLVLNWLILVLFYILGSINFKKVWKLWLYINDEMNFLFCNVVNNGSLMCLVFLKVLCR